MKVKDIIEELKLEVVVEGNLKKELSSVYIGDLLSNVMAKAKKSSIWVTIQGHQNVIAVALLVDIAAIIVAEDFSITEEALKRAKEKNVNILRCSLSAYDIACRLYEKGI